MSLVKDNKDVQIIHDFYFNKSQQSIIGQGTSGVIYKGYSKKTNQVIAIKFIKKEKINASGYFQRQLKVLRDICTKNHPNLMKFYDYKLDFDGIYYFIQFCPNGNLADFLKRGMSEVKVIKMLNQILQAMIFLNQNNRVHRDLKPENILIDSNFDIRIGDFGLTREIGLKMTQLACTPLYAAPQVIMRQSYDEKCDVWSCGLILYEMLTGKQVFKDIILRKELIDAHIKIKNGTFPIQFPSNLVLDWNKIMKQFLVYNNKQRKSFAQLKEMMDKQCSKMHSLIKKYDDHQQLSLLSSDIHEPGSQLKALGIHTKHLKEKNSLLELKAWLKFKQVKLGFIIKIIKSFNNNEKTYLKNYQKMFIIFTSLCGYLSQKRKILSQLQQGKVRLPLRTLKIDQFEPENLEQYKNIVQQSKKTQQIQIERYENSLFNEILNSKYLKRDFLEKTSDQMLDMVQHKLKGEDEGWDFYMNFYRKLINSNEYYFPDPKVMKMKDQFLRIYGLIRLVGGIDRFLPDYKFKSPRDAEKKIGYFDKCEREDLVSLVIEFNKQGQ